MNRGRSAQEKADSVLARITPPEAGDSNPRIDLVSTIRSIRRSPRCDRQSRSRSAQVIELLPDRMMLVGEEEAAAILQKLDPEEVR